MQQVTRKTLGAGINLTCVTTPKFKRAVLRTMLVLPLGGEDAALRACLPQVLRRGTARLNDMQAFGTALDELYGARIEAAVRKEGENLCIGFLSDCIDETYAPGADGLTAGVIGLLCDLLYDPYLQDGLFCTAYVEGERPHCRAQKRSAFVGAAPTERAHVRKRELRQVRARYDRAGGAHYAGNVVRGLSPCAE